MKQRTKWITIGLVVYLLLVCLLTLVEHGINNANIRTIGDSLWYSIVTLTTVGYGDFYPVTLPGKIVGAMFVVGSLGVLGLLIGEINKELTHRRELKRMGHSGTKFHDHIVIIGWNSFAKSVTVQLLGAERDVAIITDSKNNIDLIYEEFSQDHVFVLHADHNNIAFFKHANIESSWIVFVNLQDDTEKLISILNLKREYPNMQYLVTLDNADLKNTFQSAGVTYTLSKNEIASKLIASYIFEPDVAEFSNDLLSSTERADEYDIQQYLVLEKNTYAGKTYGAAFWELKEKLGCLTIGLSRVEGDQRMLHKLPSDDLVIQKGDYLIVIANGDNEKKLVQLFGVKEGMGRTIA